MITKRLLGIGFIVLGLTMIVAIIAIDWLGAGEFSGIGPVQQVALAGAGLLTLVGLSLLPLGDRPA